MGGPGNSTEKQLAFLCLILFISLIGVLVYPDGTTRIQNAYRYSAPNPIYDENGEKLCACKCSGTEDLNVNTNNLPQGILPTAQFIPQIPSTQTQPPPTTTIDIIALELELKRQKFDLWKAMGESFRKCYAEHVVLASDDINDIQGGSVGACLKHLSFQGNSDLSGNYPETVMKMLSFSNAEGDRKLCLLSESDECVTVTLGIGHDIGCEENLKLKKPECLFFGADPVFDAGVVYDKIGKFFHIGVGEKDGMLMGQIKAGLGSTDYKLSQNITGVSLDNFLRNYVKKSFIDYLWIDNEGPEFRIIDLLKKDGPVCKNFDICQINMEWHYDESKGAMNLNLNNETIPNFKARYLDFIQNTPYLHLLANSRTFYFNFDSFTCFNKYFYQYYI